jgi:hypothetical protein
VPKAGAGHDAVELVEPDEGVDLGQALGEFVPVALNHASRDDQALQSAGFLQLSGFQNGVDRFFARGLDEAARVDDDDLGFLRILDELASRTVEVAQHDLRIDEILGATEADHPHSRRSWFPRPRFVTLDIVSR